MTHQPYDTWIFEEDSLSNQQKKELYDHLLSCPSCTELQKKWGNFHKVVRNLSKVEPADEFQQRWRSGLQTRKIQKQRKQVQVFFAGLIGAVFISMVVLSILIFSSQSFFDWFLLSFTNGIRIVMQSGKILQALISWVGVIPSFYSITAGLIFISAFGLLGLAWIYMFIVHVYRRGVPTNEKNI